MDFECKKSDIAIKFVMGWTCFGGVGAVKVGGVEKHKRRVTRAHKRLGCWCGDATVIDAAALCVGFIGSAGALHMVGLVVVDMGLPKYGLGVRRVVQTRRVCISDRHYLAQ